MARTVRRLRSLPSVAVAALLAVVLAGVAVPATAAGAATRAGTRDPRSAPRAPKWEGLPPFDSRTSGRFVAPTSPVAATARAALIRSLGSQGVLDVDPLTGTPRAVARLDGFLTGTSSRPAASVAFDYVRAHLDAFGLSPADMATFRFVRDYVDVLGTHHLSWTQSFGGVPSFDHGLQAAVTRDGRLVNVVGSPMPGLSVRSTDPALAPNLAVTLALRNSGARDTTRAPLVRLGRGATRAATYADGASASLVLFGDARGTHLAWRVDAEASSTEHDISVVDATTGAVLWRANMVSFADATGHGLAWEWYDTSSLPPSDGRQQSHAFPVKDGSRLFGNNAHVYADVNDDNVPKPGAFPTGDEIPGTNKANRIWAYHVQANTTASARNCTPKFPCTWNRNLRNSWRPNLRQDATQVYYYVNNFHDHLLADPIGFTEDAGNFQLVNPTHLGHGGDAVQAQVDDGANTAGGFPDGDHIDNANMATPADGHAPRMQMYLFPANTLSSRSPDATGGDEASIVYHEYTHGLSHRLVTTANGTPALNTFQSAAMGEAWSDWYAMDYLVKQGIDHDTPTAGDVQLAFFVGGGTTKPIRTEGMDCPASQQKPLCHGAGTAGTGGYTFGDMSKIARFPEVHADGEIWGQTLWQIRQRLIVSLGQTAGVDAAESIITRAMELAPPNPGFLDMRNAILQADQVAFAGADRNLLWGVFANRGMGFFAHSDGANDATPQQSFATPVDCSAPGACGTIQGTITDADTHAPLAGILVGIPDHVLPGAPTSDDNLSAVTAVDGTYTIPDVPPHLGYTLELNGPGFEPRLVTLDVHAGAAATVNRTLRRDWAAISGGSTVVSFTRPDYTRFGCGPKSAFDLLRTKGWGSDAPGNGHSGVSGPRSIVVHLPSDVDLTNFALDPSPTCGDGAPAAVKAFRIETRRAGSTHWVLAINRTTALPLHQFTTLTPSVGKQDVRFVRFTMVSNRGNQLFMDMTELEVHGVPA